jgi:hypothetical protein
MKLPLRLALTGRQGQIWTYICYQTHVFPDCVTDELTGTYINGRSRSVQRNKKTQSAMARQLPGISA